MVQAESYRLLIEEELKKRLGCGGIPSPLLEAMGYSLLSGGKRIRPVLMLAAYEMLRGDISPCIPFAAALEMIHTYSLIHDDLPAMDDDDLRRGKATNHRVFGEGMAILAGDGLLNLAFETMLQSALSFDNPHNALLAMNAIARASGVTGMIAGQAMDVSLCGQAGNGDSLLSIHTHKTADLFRCAMEAGLYLAGAADGQLAAGRSYGIHLGLAFQLVDDLLDITGDEAVLGKKTGMDAIRQKLTWPARYGEAQTRLDAAGHIQSALDALCMFKDKGKFLETLAKNTLNRVQ